MATLAKDRKVCELFFLNLKIDADESKDFHFFGLLFVYISLLFVYIVIVLKMFAGPHISVYLWQNDEGFQRVFAALFWAASGTCFYVIVARYVDI